MLGVFDFDEKNVYAYEKVGEPLVKGKQKAVNIFAIVRFLIMANFDHGWCMPEYKLSFTGLCSLVLQTYIVNLGEVVEANGWFSQVTS